MIQVSPRPAPRLHDPDFWCGEGREGYFVYHYAKKAALPLVVLTWVSYLGLLCSLHPPLIIAISNAIRADGGGHIECVRIKISIR